MAKQALIILAVVLVFGVLVPYYKGLEFLDPAVILVYACMSLLFVVPLRLRFLPQAKQWRALKSSPAWE